MAYKDPKETFEEEPVTAENMPPQQPMPEKDVSAPAGDQNEIMPDDQFSLDDEGSYQDLDTDNDNDRDNESQDKRRTKEEEEASEGTSEKGGEKGEQPQSEPKIGEGVPEAEIGEGAEELAAEGGAEGAVGEGAAEKKAAARGAEGAAEKGAAREAEEEALKKLGQQAAEKGACALIGPWGCIIIALIFIIVGIVALIFVSVALPGVNEGDNTSSTTSANPAASAIPLYKQWDPRWGNQSYGCNTTIAQAGCGITSLAMVITYWTNKQVLPSETARVSLENGWRVCNSGTSWAAMTGMPALYGLQGRAVTWNQAKAYLEKGIPIIQSHGCCYFTMHGHFIVLTGVKNGVYQVNDPDGFHRTEATEAQILGSLSNSWVVTK